MTSRLVRGLPKSKSDFVIALRGNLPFWSLVLLIFAAMFFGGSSREDTAHILILRPIAIVALAIGLACLDRATIQLNRRPLVFGCAMIVLVAIQLIPLPPFVWQSLPGRAPMIEAASLIGADDSWRPITMVPWRTVNSLFALSVPLAALVLMCVLDARKRHRMFLVMIIAASFSALFGLLQALGPDVASLRFYTIYNEGVSTGLFANRNHQAVFLSCLIVMVVAYGEHFASDEILLSARRLIVGAIVLLLIFLILMTGSRAGAIVMLLALSLSLAVVRLDPGVHKADSLVDKLRAGWREIVGILIIVMLALIFLFSRSVLVGRLESGSGADDIRFQVWGPVIVMIERYFPFGSGFGTFPDVYKFDEPLALITDSYMNHAHNDWLEIPLEGGFVAVALIGAAIIAYSRRCRSVFSQPRSGHILARCGLILIFLLAAASLTDYPIRTPIMACFFAIASVWTLTADRFTRPARKRRK